MEKKNRLQIPVNPGLEDAINDLASRMGISQASMTSLLLDVALDDREKIVEWFASRCIYTLVRSVKGKSWEKKGDGPTYLQTWLDPDLSKRLEIMAENVNQVPSKYAALVLECAVDDYDWLIKVVTSRLSQKLLGFGKRRKNKKATENRKTI